MRVPFGEWLPDQPALDNPGCTVAQNVIPGANGYLPLKELSADTTALNTSDEADSVFAAGLTVFAGGDSTLELLDNINLTWSDVSKSGGYFGPGTGALGNLGSWDFCQIGSRVIAANGNDDTQKYDIGSSSVFSDLGGSPPRGNCIANIRRFIVIGDADGDDGKLQWSGYNNSELWTPSRATQSDTRTLEGNYGSIVRIVPGEVGLVFRERSITVMRYTGPPTIFSFDLVSRGAGAISGGSVCWYGDKVFYLASDGFYQFGNPPTPIGSEKVNRWFFDDVDIDGLYRVRGAVNPETNCVYWVYGNLNTNRNRVIIYNWVTGQWSYGNTSTRGIGTISGQSLNGASNQDVLVVFDTSNRLARFTGDEHVAVFETKELGFARRSAVNVRPLVEGVGTSITVADGTRNDDDDTPSFTSGKAPTAKGDVNFRTPARYHRERVTIGGNFTSATGVDLEPVQGGLR